MSSFDVSQKEQYMRSIDSVKSSPPVDRDPDSVEQLLTQALNHTFELKEVMRNMRQQYLGSWPENAQAKEDRLAPEGLVPNMKDALYKMIETHREIREHIAAISKGVR